MILSVSRRTDIPNYYSDWFIARIKEGFLYVRNPMNAHQISKIDLSPEVVDRLTILHGHLMLKTLIQMVKHTIARNGRVTLQKLRVKLNRTGVTLQSVQIQMSIWRKMPSLLLPRMFP